MFGMGQKVLSYLAWSKLAETEVNEMKHSFRAWRSSFLVKLTVQLDLDCGYLKITEQIPTILCKVILSH